jgi:hypothetical protein
VVTVPVTCSSVWAAAGVIPRAAQNPWIISGVGVGRFVGVRVNPDQVAELVQKPSRRSRRAEKYLGGSLVDWGSMT